MNYPRVYHTSVVLPDGKVFTAGGQVWGKPFNESNVQFVPELYDPVTDSFEPQSNHNMIRVYHSISMLLPDATVFNGGGGLCGNCSFNHYDAQIFIPPYLLTPSGKRRARPEIKTVDETVTVGQVLKFTTDKVVESASLVRQGTTTHTVNTDQRRVPLNIEAGNGNSFTAKLPDSSGALLPGWYMLFAMDANGTPSEAATVKVELPKAATSELEELDQSDVDMESEDHAECEDEKMPATLAALLSSPIRVWKSWRPTLVL